MERSGLLESKVLRIEVLTHEVYRVDDFISFHFVHLVTALLTEGAWVPSLNPFFCFLMTVLK